MSPEQIIEKTSTYTTCDRYDGVIPLKSGYVPYKYLTIDKINKYMKTWDEMGDEINREMREWIEENCEENPDVKYVSRDWIPIAEFNGGSDLFAMINNGINFGVILGILDSPYRVVKVASNIDDFMNIGKNNHGLID